MQVVTYGTAEESAHRENSKQAVNAFKVAATIMAGLMAAAMIAAMSASVQVSDNTSQAVNGHASMRGYCCHAHLGKRSSMYACMCAGYDFTPIIASVHFTPISSPHAFSLVSAIKCLPVSENTTSSIPLYPSAEYGIGRPAAWQCSR